MNTSPMPEWIKERQAQRSRLAASKVAAEGLVFWKDLIARLKVNVEGLAGLDSRGKVSCFENASSELTCRIDVFNSLSRGLTHTDLFYIPGDPKIRTLTMEGDSLTYSFTISPDGQLAVIPSDQYSPKTATQVADALVEAMFDRTP